MTDHQNFSNNDHDYSIYLDENGALYFKSADKDSTGHTVLTLSHVTGQATLGGLGQDGALQLRNASGANTVFLGGTGSEANALLGGESGQAGRVRLSDGTGRVTVDLAGDGGFLVLGADGVDGNFVMLDSNGFPSVFAEASSGALVCVSLTERPITSLRAAAGAPLDNALASVMALRGVRCPRAASVAGHEFGLVDDDVEKVLPELVTTDREGRRSVHYSRLNVVLVEAVKEQQRLIRDQAEALAEALQRISALEAGAGPDAP